MGRILRRLPATLATAAALVLAGAGGYAFGGHYHQHGFANVGLVHGDWTDDRAYFSRIMHSYLAYGYCAVGNHERSYILDEDDSYGGNCSAWSMRVYGYTAVGRECAGWAYSYLNGVYTEHLHGSHSPCLDA